LSHAQSGVDTKSLQKVGLLSAFMDHWMVHGNQGSIRLKTIDLFGLMLYNSDFDNSNRDASDRDDLDRDDRMTPDSRRILQQKLSPELQTQPNEMVEARCAVFTDSDDANDSTDDWNA
jgi:hypothetical protein